MDQKPMFEDVPREYTQDEKLRMGLELARMTGELNNLEAQKKAALGQFNVDIASTQKLMDSLAERLRIGFELENAPVTVEYDKPEKGVKTITRVDTIPHKFVRTAPMTPSELQRSLELFYERDMGDMPPPESPEA